MDEKGRKKDSRSKKRFLQHCGKVLLITASYQVFSVCMNPINLQSPQKKSDHGDIVLNDTVPQVSSFFVSPAYGYDIPIPQDSDIECIMYHDRVDNSWENAQRAQERADWKAEQRAEKERQRKAEAFNLNEKGNSAWGNRDWKAAVDYFTKALRLSPADKVIRQNLKNAQDYLASEKQEAKSAAKEKARTEALQKEFARRRQRETIELNVQGAKYYGNKQWKLAADAFKTAMDRNPNDQTIRNKYKKALQAAAAEAVSTRALDQAYTRSKIQALESDQLDFVQEAFHSVFDKEVPLLHANIDPGVGRAPLYPDYMGDKRMAKAQQELNELKKKGAESQANLDKLVRERNDAKNPATMNPATMKALNVQVEQAQKENATAQFATWGKKEEMGKIQKMISSEREKAAPASGADNQGTTQRR